MPKMKSKKAVLARFSLTGAGHLKRTRPGKRHKLQKKSSAVKRHLSERPLVDSGQEKMYKRLMQV